MPEDQSLHAAIYDPLSASLPGSLSMSCDFFFFKVFITTYLVPVPRASVWMARVN